MFPIHCIALNFTSLQCTTYHTIHSIELHCKFTTLLRPGCLQSNHLPAYLFCEASHPPFPRPPFSSYFLLLSPSLLLTMPSSPTSSSSPPPFYSYFLPSHFHNTLECTASYAGSCLSKFITFYVISSKTRVDAAQNMAYQDI